MRLFLFCLTLTCFCCTKKTVSVEQGSTTQTSVNLSQIAENLLGKETAQVSNEAKTLTLFYQVHDAETTQSTKYIVLDNVNGAVITKGSFKAGYIKWKSDTSLEIFDLPGIIPQGKKQSDYIKVITLPIHQN
jgi:ribosome biogenesis GTPase A